VTEPVLSETVIVARRSDKSSRAVARQAADTEPHADATLRALEEVDTRLKLGRAAEADKNEIEFKPCQNVIDYQLPFKLSPVKN